MRSADASLVMEDCHSVGGTVPLLGQLLFFMCRNDFFSKLLKYNNLQKCAQIIKGPFSSMKFHQVNMPITNIQTKKQNRTRSPNPLLCH